MVDDAANWQAEALGRPGFSPSQSKTKAQRCTPVVPAIQEAGAERIQALS